MVDRLKLSPKTLETCAVGCEQLAAMPDIIGSISGMSQQPSGIRVGQMRVPIGVFGMIYESRPNVTIEAASLAIKSGNACILRGGSEAIESNTALAGLVSQALLAAGLPEHAVRLLEDDRMLMVFPEGARGTAKLFKERYSLVGFGTGFMRLALRTKTPIVPLAFLGGGEAVPTISNAYSLGKLLGVPYIPVTPYLVALPLPVKLEVHFAPPMTFAGDGSEDDEVIAGYVAQVKTVIADMLDKYAKQRRGER
jgi:1-acyl-sn-glycerol-3-phosphate acyltransferase